MLSQLLVVQGSNSGRLLMKKRKISSIILAMLFVMILIPHLPVENDSESREERIQRMLNEMRAGIKANGWGFEVGDNEALQYDLNQLCGFKPELDMDNSIREYIISEKIKRICL